MATALSRTTIVAAALDLIEHGGPQHLTMRRLANRLGVTATALYYHVDNRQEVLDAVADQLCADIAADVPASGPWPERLEAALLYWFERTVRYPTAMGWAMIAYADKQPVLRLHDMLLGVLYDAGFTDDAALHVKGALLRYSIGHLLIRELKQQRKAAPQAGERFPHYRASGAAMKRFDPDAQFRIGLAALIDGFTRSSLAPPPGGSIETAQNGTVDSLGK